MAHALSVHVYAMNRGEFPLSRICCAEFSRKMLTWGQMQMHLHAFKCILNTLEKYLHLDLHFKHFLNMFQILLK